MIEKISARWSLKFEFSLITFPSSPNFSLSLRTGFVDCIIMPSEFLRMRVNAKKRKNRPGRGSYMDLGVVQNLVIDSFTMRTRRLPWSFRARVTYVCDGDSAWLYDHKSSQILMAQGIEAVLFLFDGSINWRIQLPKQERGDYILITVKTGS